MINMFYYLHTNYDFELKFNATENYQSYGTGKSFELTDTGTANHPLPGIVGYQDDTFRQMEWFLEFIPAKNAIGNHE